MIQTWKQWQWKTMLIETFNPCILTQVYIFNSLLSITVIFSDFKLILKCHLKSLPGTDSSSERWSARTATARTTRRVGGSAERDATASDIRTTSAAASSGRCCPDPESSSSCCRKRGGLGRSDRSSEIRFLQRTNFLKYKINKIGVNKCQI